MRRFDGIYNENIYQENSAEWSMYVWSVAEELPVCYTHDFDIMFNWITNPLSHEKIR